MPPEAALMFLLLVHTEVLSYLSQHLHSFQLLNLSDWQVLWGSMIGHHLNLGCHQLMRIQPYVVLKKIPCSMGQFLLAALYWSGDVSVQSFYSESFCCYESYPLYVSL
jgi:hypothetical protein